MSHMVFFWAQVLGDAPDQRRVLVKHMTRATIPLDHIADTVRHAPTQQAGDAGRVLGNQVGWRHRQTPRGLVRRREALEHVAERLGLDTERLALREQGLRENGVILALVLSVPHEVAQGAERETDHDEREALEPHEAALEGGEALGTLRDAAVGGGDEGEGVVGHKHTPGLGKNQRERPRGATVRARGRPGPPSRELARDDQLPHVAAAGPLTDEAAAGVTPDAALHRHTLRRWAQGG